MNLINRLQKWYELQCDGDWEHSYGIKIETLDNPGWLIEIDLEYTSIQDFQFNLSEENGDLDWFNIKIENRKFMGYCSPNKLDFLINYFFENIIYQYSDKDFIYEALVPILGGSTQIWATCEVKQIDNNLFEIVKIDNPKYNTILTKNVEDITFSEEEFNSFTVKHKIGDFVKMTLVETFQGVRQGII